MKLNKKNFPTEGKLKFIAVSEEIKDGGKWVREATSWMWPSSITSDVSFSFSSSAPALLLFLDGLAEGSREEEANLDTEEGRFCVQIVIAYRHVLVRGGGSGEDSRVSSSCTFLLN